MSAITAKYPGTCRACRGRIDVGTPILWARGEGVRHVECPAMSDCRCRCHANPRCACARSGYCPVHHDGCDRCGCES